MIPKGKRSNFIKVFTRKKRIFLILTHGGQIMPKREKIKLSNILSLDKKIKKKII